MEVLAICFFGNVLIFSSYIYTYVWYLKVNNNFVSLALSNRTYPSSLLPYCFPSWICQFSVSAAGYGRFRCPTLYYHNLLLPLSFILSFLLGGWYNVSLYFNLHFNDYQFWGHVLPLDFVSLEVFRSPLFFFFVDWGFNYVICMKALFLYILQISSSIMVFFSEHKFSLDLIKWIVFMLSIVRVLRNPF